MTAAVRLAPAVVQSAIVKLRRAESAWRARVRFAEACDHRPLLRRARREVAQISRLVQMLSEASRG